MWSRLPVICSNTSSLPEAGGNAALYFDPHDHKLLAKLMLDVATDEALAEDLRNKGYQQAQLFDTEKYGNNIMEIYKSLQ